MLDNIRNIARKPSEQQADRLPVQTYDQAIGRLCLIALNPDTTSREIDVAVQLVADVFWVPDTRVMADVIRRCKEFR